MTTPRQLRKNLEQIKLPPGFKINLYAVVPDARHIAVGPQGVVTFVGTRKDAVWAITDRNKDGTADEVKRFAPSLAFDIPNGPCFSKDGFLYIAERNRILVFPAAEFFYESPDIAVGQVVKQGELIPKEEESFNHTARVCRGRAGQEALCAARPALQRAAQGEAGAVREGRHRRHRAHEPATAARRRSTRSATAIRSAWISIR